MASQATRSDGTHITAYSHLGLMGETIWTHLLEDLKAENMTAEFKNMTHVMRERIKEWAGRRSPFGSEMGWDSTGQEPVFAWAKYFSNEDLQQKALNSIRGYMPTVAHWGWNGNARRYWDFVYGGKLRLLERMIHHYGSSLNALPLLTSYKYNRDPSSAAALYDLRVGYGGIMGPLSNINAEGFASTAFHSYPNRLKWDGYSGDYGPTTSVLSWARALYLVQHPDFGWISMGGNVAPSSNNDVIVVEPRDTVRRSIYVAAMGLSVTFESGVITSFAYVPQSKKLIITLQAVPGDTKTASTIVKYESTLGGKVSLESPTAGVKRGGYVVSVPEKVVFTAR